MNRISNPNLRNAIYLLAFMLIGFILPWWSILFVAGFIGWFEFSLSRAILTAATTCFVAWLLLTLGFDIAQGFRISTRLGGLVGLPVPIVASLFSAVIGGVVSGLFAGAINQLRVVAKALTSS